MKYIYLFLATFLILGAWSCAKDKTGYHTNCEKLIRSLVADDKESVRVEVNNIINELSLQSGVSFVQQQQDMNLFISRLSECDELEAEVLCLWCVKTNPPQTEILIKFTRNGEQVTKVVDLVQTGSGFRFSSMHE